ncbi:MAG: gamma-glutamylcyclotransferase family protein [Myxococcota bacterium]
MLYFAYGSNLSSARLHARVGEVQCQGPARLPGHEHRFSKLGRDGTGKGTIAPHPYRAVHGVLYELSPPQWQQLATFEGGYRDTELRIQDPEGTLVPARTYIALSPGTPPSPSLDYLAHYRRGFIEHGLPRAYAEAILRDGGDRRPLVDPNDAPLR